MVLHVACSACGVTHFGTAPICRLQYALAALTPHLPPLNIIWILGLQLGLPAPEGTDSAAAQAFIEAAARQLLDASPTSKGRYVPLSLLLPRLGARHMLQQRPQLVAEVWRAVWWRGCGMLFPPCVFCMLVAWAG